MSVAPPPPRPIMTTKMSPDTTKCSRGWGWVESPRVRTAGPAELRSAPRGGPSAITATPSVNTTCFHGTGGETPPHSHHPSTALPTWCVCGGPTRCEAPALLIGPSMGPKRPIDFCLLGFLNGDSRRSQDGSLRPLKWERVMPTEA